MTKKKVQILGANVDVIDMQGALGFVAEAIAKAADSSSEGRAFSPKHIITLNAEIIYQARSEQELMALINTADLVTPDGAGVVWAAKYKGNPVPERVTGIGLLEEILKIAAATGWKLFFFGGAPGVALEAQRKATEKYPGLKVVGTNHGYLTSPTEEKELLNKIKEKQPDILFVALGAPKQEYWIRDQKESLQVPVNIGVGGSFDVLAGKVNRAPVLMQKLQLEWLYRLLQEPARYKRMLALPKFLLQVLADKR